VVLATVTHFNSFVMEVRLAGITETLQPTDRHRLFSVTRDDWVPTSQLRAGEELATINGVFRIESVRFSSGTHRVYNIEVETEHCFYAGAAGVLSHNQNPCAGGAISVDDALSLADKFMDLGTPIRSVDGKTGVQFIQTGVDNLGQTITKRVGLDLNLASPHVQQIGPHLNLQTQINGVIQRAGALADPHIPINPSTIRPGDF
jgi:hypothetical protein